MRQEQLFPPKEHLLNEVNFSLILTHFALLLHHQRQGWQRCRHPHILSLLYYICCSGLKPYIFFDNSNSATAFQPPQYYKLYLESKISFKLH